MGRWAQRSRRASSGQPGGATPSITQVVDEGSGLLAVYFTAEVAVNAGGVPESVAVEIDGNPVDVTSASSLGSNSVEIQQGVDPAAGASFVLRSQPTWLTTQVSTNQPLIIT